MSVQVSDEELRVFFEAAIALARQAGKVQMSFLKILTVFVFTRFFPVIHSLINVRISNYITIQAAK